MATPSRRHVSVVLLALLAALLAGLLVRSFRTRAGGEPRTDQERAMVDAARRGVEGVLGRPLTDLERRMIVIDRKGGRMSGARIEAPLADELRRRSDARTAEPASRPASHPTTGGAFPPGP